MGWNWGGAAGQLPRGQFGSSGKGRMDDAGFEPWAPCHGPIGLVSDEIGGGVGHSATLKPGFQGTLATKGLLCGIAG